MTTPKERLEELMPEMDRAIETKKKVENLIDQILTKSCLVIDHSAIDWLMGGRRYGSKIDDPLSPELAKKIIYLFSETSIPL